MLRNFPLSVVALTVVACLGAVSSHAASSGALATQVQKDVSSAGAPLKNGATAAAGVPVVTGANSRAELQLPNGTTVRVGQGSSVSFDGANLSLAQGSALFKLGGGKAKIATPALKCAATGAVISAHCAKNYEAFFVIEGSAAVDGVNLKAGEGWVRENGSARKIAFDVKRMLDTSFLVTKFPKTLWIVEAFAAAAIQSELLAANRAQSALLSGRAPAVTGAAGKGHAASAAAVTVAARNSSGAGAGTVASNGGGGVSGGTLNLGNVSSGSSTSASLSAGSIAVSGGTISANNWSSSAGASGSLSTGLSTTGTTLTKTGGGVLNLSGTNAYTGGSGATVITRPITTGAGALILSGANTFTGISGATVNTGGASGLVPGGSVDTFNINTTLVTTGAGSVLISGSSTVHATGAQTLTNVNVSNGTVVAGSDGTLRLVPALQAAPSKH